MNKTIGLPDGLPPEAHEMEYKAFMAGSNVIYAREDKDGPEIVASAVDSEADKLPIWKYLVFIVYFLGAMTLGVILAELVRSLLGHI